MAKLTPYEIEDLLQRLIKELPASVQSKIKVEVVNREVELTTRFGPPHLDVSVDIDDSGFIANYSNDTREENTYSNTADTAKIAEDAFRNICSLIKHGATLHIRKNRKGQVISMRTDIAGEKGETNVLKFNFLSRVKEYTKSYPPVK